MIRYCALTALFLLSISLLGCSDTDMPLIARQPLAEVDSSVSQATTPDVAIRAVSQDKGLLSTSNTEESLVPAKLEDNQAPLTASNQTTSIKPKALSKFKTIEWTDLIPEDDLQALLNPPSYITDIEDGSIEDQIASQLQSTLDTVPDDPYQQALVSTRIVSEMDGQSIRIPGFIVPLDFDDNQVITKFFLVPFFGACIHVPPPPPNQIIYVEFEKGIQLEVLYDPFWITGTLNTSIIENDLALAAYSLEMEGFEPYSFTE